MAAAAAGLALAEADPPAIVAAAAVVFGFLCALRAAALGALAAALILAGAQVGELRLADIDAGAARLRDGEHVALRANLLTAPRPGRFGASAEAEVASGGLRGTRLLLRIPRWSPLPASVRAGDELWLEGRTEALEDDAAEAAGTDARDSDGGASFDFAAHLRRRGIAGELLLDRARLTGGRRGGLAGVLDGLTARAETGVSAGMEPEAAALLRGMVLGHDETIAAPVRDDFRASGLAHLLAVSGQNVMLLAALALPLLVLAGLGRRGRLVTLAVLVAVYVPLAGAGPSLQRAGVMGLAGLAAMAASRPASRSYALLLAAVATLAWNPRAWGDPGWQLSFAAVGGILLIGVPMARVMHRAAAELLPRAPALISRGADLVADGVAITVAASVATAPLLAYHFDAIPLAGLPANVLALPVVAPAMWLGMLKIAAGMVGVPDAVAAALGVVAAVPVGALSTLAERFADLPGGRLSLPLRSPPAVGAAYAAMTAAVLALRRAGRPLAPHAFEAMGRLRRLPRLTRATLAAVAACLVVLAAAWVLRAPGAPDRLTVRFLDVGQGDATLIQHPDGTAILFDGGPPEAAVARLLRQAGVRRLALVVATHPSRDHHGGLAEVLRTFPVETLLDGGDGTRDPGFLAVLREAAAHGVRRVRATAPLALSLAGGDLRIRVLSPKPRPPGPPPEDPNPRAVVAVVSAGWFDLLLSADAESEALLPLDLPDVDAMKVPHHGSADPGLPEVLDELDPELAAIEVGPNTYGHPTPSTLATLHHAGVVTHRTDREGTITVSIDHGGMTVGTER